MTTTLRLVDGATEVVLRPASPSSADPIFLTEYDLGFPEMRETAQEAAGQSGTIDLTTLHGGRNVSMELVVVDDGTMTRHQRADLLRILCHPAKRPYLYVLQDGWSAERRMVLRGNQFSMAVDSTAKARLKATVAWAAPYGVLESTTVSEYHIRPAGGGSGWTFSHSFPSTNVRFTASNSTSVTSIVNTGTATAAPVFRISGTMTGPTIRNGTTGEVLTLPNMSVPAGQFVDVDVAARTVYLNGTPGSTYYQYIDWSTSTWWEFQPGTNLLSLSALAQDSSAELVVFFRERWL